MTLESWCRDHALAAPPRIAATRIQGVERLPAPNNARASASATETVRHRRVQLRCGNRVLSEADNWYVPGRLTTEMNRLLDTTDTPFGRAVQPLGPYRRTLEVRMLWAPLPDGWERQPRDRRGRGGNRGWSADDSRRVVRASAVLYTQITRRSPRFTKSTSASCWRFSSPIEQARHDMSRLDRFKRAQDDPHAGFEQALEEIRAGQEARPLDLVRVPAARRAGDVVDGARLRARRRSGSHGVSARPAVARTAADDHARRRGTTGRPAGSYD